MRELTQQLQSELSISPHKRKFREDFVVTKGKEETAGEENITLAMSSEKSVDGLQVCYL